MLFALIGTLCFAASVGTLAFAGEDTYRGWLDRLEVDFKAKLRRLRIRTPKLRTYLNAWIILVVFAFLLLWLIFDLFILGLALAAIFISLPWYIVRRMAEKRKTQIEDQLADAMVQLSSAIKAGLSLAQAIDVLAQQTPMPICQEFQQMGGEYQLGKPLERCLVETKQRLDSENFALFAAAMEASRESGGRLNETVERIAYSVRELQRLERKVESETAQARKSASYMALAPIVVLLVYYFFIDPVNTERLFTTVWGQVLLSAAIFLDVIAYLWARVILNPDI